MKLRIAAIAASLLAGGSLLLFAHGYQKNQHRKFVDSVAERNYAAGRTDAVAEQAVALEQARQAAQKAAQARIDAARAERDAAVAAADQAERRRRAAIAELRSQDATFAECDAAIYPDSVHAFPVNGVRE